MTIVDQGNICVGPFDDEEAVLKEIADNYNLPALKESLPRAYPTNVIPPVNPQKGRYRWI